MDSHAQGIFLPVVFSFHSSFIRSFTDDVGAPWFNVADVCAVLGYKKPLKAIGHHCRGNGVTKRSYPGGIGSQEMAFVNEVNLFRLIIQSQKAAAFETWATETLLPTIRRIGTLVTPQANNSGLSRQWIMSLDEDGHMQTKPLSACMAVVDLVRD